MEEKHSDLPLIGFTAWFNNFGETYPLVTIAKAYIDIGGQAIFFGYGQKYQDLAKSIGCKVIAFQDHFSEKMVIKMKMKIEKYNENKIPMDSFLLDVIDKDNYEFDINNIKNEIAAFKDHDIKLLITGYNFHSNISARAAKVPLIYIISGAGIAPYYKQKLAKFPDSYENFFTRLIPGFIKNPIANWFILNNKSSVKEYNRLASEFNASKIKHYLDLALGDYTLVVEDLAFLNIKPTAEFPAKHFVGPIFQEKITVNEGDSTEVSIKKHLERPGRSVLVSLGSSGTRKLFFEILRALEKTDINVIAIYTTIFNEGELPGFKNNILPIKFVPSIKKVNEMVDLAILHGGRGTVYTAVYAGKPVVGIPMQTEQQINLDNLVRHGAGIRISKKYFSEKKLLQAIKDIFDNYDVYLKNAQQLKNKLPEPKGAENIVKILLEIIEKEKI